MLGPGLYLSPRAAYDCQALAIGEGSWVAAGVLLHGTLQIGRRCSLNPGCTGAAECAWVTTCASPTRRA